MILEIVVETVEDAIAAENGGADQIEVKCDYLEYGLTPTAGMLEQVCNNTSCNVLCMVRPHARSYVNSKADLAAMASDIKQASSLPIKGFLLGCLTSQGDLDIAALKYLKEAAGSLALHFHLAWELTPNPYDTLDQLIELGFTSVRTSGGGGISGSVGKNLAKIRDFVKHTKGDLNFFLAGGITIENVTQIVSKTGIDRVHSGSGVREPSIRTGVVSEDKVRAMKQAMIRAKFIQN